MEFPTKFLAFTILVHGLLGAFQEILDSMLNKMATPLGNFYNESIFLHYNIELNDSGIQTCLSLIGNLKLIGSIFAVIFILPKMDSWGRKPIAVYLRTAFSSISAILMIISKFSNSVELFSFGAFAMGAALPLRTGINKLYISECAPDSNRGFSTQSISTLSQVVLLISGVLMLPGTFGNETFWYLVPAFVLSMAAVFLSLSFAIPESPKFLSISGNKKAARDAIRKFSGIQVDTDAILQQYDREFQTTESSHTTFRQLWANPTLRDSLYLVLITSLIPFFGIPQIFYLYGIPLKIRFGFTNEQALYLDLILSFLFIPVFFAIPYLYERIGRRPVFLVTNFLSIIGSVTVLFAQMLFVHSGSSIFTIALAGIFSFLFMLVNAMGASIFYIILIADLLPASAKASTSQAALLSANISAIIANFGYATLEPLLGSTVFIPFVLVQIFFVFYCYRNLPETRQRAVYENFEEMRSRSNSFAPILRKPNLLTVNYGTTQGYSSFA